MLGLTEYNDSLRYFKEFFENVAQLFDIHSDWQAKPA